jgi:PmbA protein
MVIEEILEIAEKTVKLAQKKKATQSQVAAFLVDSALTRYANSQIHQNVATKKGGVAVQVAIGKRIGTLCVNSLETKAIEDAVNTAVKIAEVTLPNKDFKSLPKPMKWTPIRDVFDKKTADCSPDYRAESVKEAIDTAHSKSRYVKAVAGSISTGYFAFAVANSLGVSAWAKISSSSMQTTVISESRNSKGFSSSEQHSRRIEDIDPTRIAERAAERSVKSINPKKIQIGDYEVVLSSRAIAELFIFLGYIGFSATPYQDGQSFVKYNLNKQTFDEKLTIEDDPRNPQSLYSFAVDGEGVPKKRLTLIEKGKVSEQSICYDSFTAGKEKGRVSTGHALPPVFGFYGGRARPMPFNLIVDTGDSSTDEMIQETRRGIFVTRFHYTNPTEPAKAILTGLTRDGTFLIENGEITKPVMNLRYTDSMLSALKEIPMIGRELEIVDDVTSPSMKLKKLRFTGTTQY